MGHTALSSLCLSLLGRYICLWSSLRPLRSRRYVDSGSPDLSDDRAATHDLLRVLQDLHPLLLSRLLLAAVAAAVVVFVVVVLLRHDFDVVAVVVVGVVGAGWRCW